MRYAWIGLDLISALRELRVTLSRLVCINFLSRRGPGDAANIPEIQYTEAK